MSEGFSELRREFDRAHSFYGAGAMFVASGFNVRVAEIRHAKEGEDDPFPGWAAREKTEIGFADEDGLHWMDYFAIGDQTAAQEFIRLASLAGSTLPDEIADRLRYYGRPTNAATLWVKYLAEISLVWYRDFAGWPKEELENCSIIPAFLVPFDASAYQAYKLASADGLPEQTPSTVALQDNIAKATHSLDFASANWYGTPYEFTPHQAACVQVLWEAWENGTPTLGEAAIQTHANVNSAMRTLFANHPAWRTMITSPSKGRYRLEVPPEKSDQSAN